MTDVVVQDPPHDNVTMYFALEPYSEKLVQEMRPLWDAHHQEIPQLNMQLDPDLTLYSTMNRIGTLRIYTARIGPEKDRMLCGYMIFGVMRHPHRKYSLEANGDLVYMDPECRRGFTAIRFMQWCWSQLEKEGVEVIHMNVDAQNDWGHLLERYGFKLRDLSYARRT